MSEQKKFFYTPLKGKPVDEALAKEVMMLHEAGWSNVAIGKKVGRHNSNIQRLLKKLSNGNVISYKSSHKQDEHMKVRRAIGVQAPEESISPDTPSTVGSAPDISCGRDSETLEQKVRRLERELSEARMERDLYNEIINVAEKRFDIQIRKKAGTKQ